MKKPGILFAKTILWLYCLTPVLTLGWQMIHNTLGPDPTATLALSTGLAALTMLVASLAISPLRRLWSRLGWLITLRRPLGLFAFFYATLHLAIYLALYAGFDLATITTDVSRRLFILSGVVGWLLLLPLALTSTQAAIRRLGGGRWRRLHRLAYLAAIAAVVHYWWQVKPGVRTPLGVTVILAILLASRLIPRRRSA